MSKKDLVRDGRLQTPKKRTDRSYLSSSGAATAPVAEPEASEAATDAAMDDAIATAAAVSAAPAVAAAPAAASASASASATAAAQAKRAAGAARALEQQGVRKRRELDVEALAKRDSDYAKHELRRIAIFAGIIFATLIVLAIVLA